MKTIKFHKAECGVEVLLRVGLGHELPDSYLGSEVYNTDFFEVLLFKKGRGTVLLNQRTVPICDNTLVFISPFQKRQWQLDADHLEFTFLIFQEDFLNDFFADKLFAYRLLFFYQLDYPLFLTVSREQMLKYCGLLTEIGAELRPMRADSGHLIRSLLYYLLLSLNRSYAERHALPLGKAENHYAYHFKRLLEQHITEKQRVAEYAALLGISRITLNKAVQAQFNVTATHLLKQRLLFEIKNALLHAGTPVTEIAHALHFSEPSHLMRFFKAQTGQTTSEFLATHQ